MKEASHCYIAIDLKSFYASVECVERSFNPLTTHLVVADAGRTEKTICLAVSPSLKAYGIPGRARLFEVVEKVKKINQGTGAGAPVPFYPNFWPWASFLSAILLMSLRSTWCG